MSKKASKRDILTVWGKPPQALTDGLTKSQMAALRRYVEMVHTKCYRLAFDCGVDHGIATVVEQSEQAWRKRMASRR